jgi:hypothetical protein
MASFPGKTIGRESIETVLAIPVPADGKLNLPERSALATQIWRMDEMASSLCELCVAFTEQTRINNTKQNGFHSFVQRNFTPRAPTVLKLTQDTFSDSGNSNVI